MTVELSPKTMESEEVAYIFQTLKELFQPKIL